MTDIEKVKKGLRYCNNHGMGKYDDPPCNTGCPYRQDSVEPDCDDILHEDALKLIEEQQAEIERLKEQKPVKPIQFEKTSRITRDKYECGACGSSEIYKEWDFCPWCGKPIDWSKDCDQE